MHMIESEISYKHEVLRDDAAEVMAAINECAIKTSRKHTSLENKRCTVLVFAEKLSAASINFIYDTFISDDRMQSIQVKEVKKNIEGVTDIRITEIIFVFKELNCEVAAHVIFEM